MFTVGGLAVVATVVVPPLLLSSIGLAGATATHARVALAGAPDRRTPRWQWVSVGSLLATLTWIAGTFCCRSRVWIIHDWPEPAAGWAMFVVPQEWEIHSYRDDSMSPKVGVIC
jgi:hypothetical protein